MTRLLSLERWTRAELGVLVLLTGVGAAIAGPALIRAAATANEAQAIADTRAVISAEDAYAAANSGFYANIVNLCRNGGNCAGIGIPNYPPTEPEFISPDLGRVSPYLKDGYVRSFVNGPAPVSLPPEADPQSVHGFCYNSEPEVVGSERSFSGDGSGHLREDVSGTAIPCPVPTATPPLVDDLADELAVDFGVKGFWLYDGALWQQLTPWDAALAGRWGNKIVVSFGPGRGLWTYDVGGWTQLTPWAPYAIVGQEGRLLAAFDAGRGLWSFDGSVWQQLTPWEPTQMIGYGNKLAVDFGPGRGVWLHWPPEGFTQLTPWDAYGFHDLNGQLLAAFNNGRGIWETRLEYWWPTAQWTQETNWEPRDMATLRVGSTVDLAAEFGPGRGIWRLSGTQLTNWTSYLLIGDNGDVAAAFDNGRGLYRYQDGSGWTRLTNWEPTHLASTENYLGVAFDQGRGVYRHDGGGWTQLTNWTAESLTPVAVLP